jgi:hypothetical protein
MTATRRRDLVLLPLLVAGFARPPLPGRQDVLYPGLSRLGRPGLLVAARCQRIASRMDCLFDVLEDAYRVLGLEKLPMAMRCSAAWR